MYKINKSKIVGLEVYFKRDRRIRGHIEEVVGQGKYVMVEITDGNRLISGSAHCKKVKVSSIMVSKLEGIRITRNGRDVLGRIIKCGN